MPAKTKRIVLAALSVLIAVFECVLLALDGRVLISEKKIEEGQKYPSNFPAEYAAGKLHHSGQAVLFCKYFNGRYVMGKVYWYSSNNIFGRDSCRVLVFGD